jgi:hypothetical protein
LVLVKQPGLACSLAVPADVAVVSPLAVAQLFLPVPVVVARWVRLPAAVVQLVSAVMLAPVVVRSDAAVAVVMSDAVVMLAERPVCSWPLGSMS